MEFDEISAGNLDEFSATTGMLLPLDLYPVVG